jgi:hypothetical protein
MAAVSPPRAEHTNRQFFRLCGGPHKRKNWLFVGSEKGGQTAAVLLSFTATCQRLGVEPWAYLQDTLTRLPSTPTERLSALLPDRWQAARQATATPSAPIPPDPALPSAGTTS